MLGDQLLSFVSFLHTFGNTSENNSKSTFNHCSKLSHSGSHRKVQISHYQSHIFKNKLNPSKNDF